MSSGDNIGLSLDLDATGDETLRNEYNINSPKAKGGSSSGRSGETERQQYGINSPRAADRKKKVEVKQDGADDDPPAALAALTTQVTKDDNNPRAKPADRTVSDEPRSMNTEANAAPAQSQSSCWSAIFCCCAPSLPQQPPQQPRKRLQDSKSRRPTQAVKKQELPITSKPAVAPKPVDRTPNLPPVAQDPTSEYEDGEDGTAGGAGAPVRQATPDRTPDLPNADESDVAVVVDAAQPAAVEALVTQVPRTAQPQKTSTQTTNEEAAGESAMVQELEADNRLEAADNGDDEMPGVQALDGTQDEEEEVSDSGEDPKGYLGPRPKGKKRCLVLDLDETLVHSSFKPPASGDPTPDFIVPVVIDGITHKVYVLKRPFADEFLRETAKHWELVIFTASLSKYADPLLDMLDKERVITDRLFREHCVLYRGTYVKDLSKVGRKLKNQVFIDNAPKSYLFQPNNAVPITSWFDDMNDTELKDIIPVLNTTLLEVDDVRSVLDANNKSFRWLCRQATQAPES